MKSAFSSHQDLRTSDPEIADAIVRESHRQEEGLELIASENYVSPAVLEAQGSLFTNKYAEGYVGKRYYGGCEYVDQAEKLAVERVTRLFKAEAANVQPHSGSQANMAALLALVPPGGTLMGMDLAQGGHLTHGSPVNFSGKLFRSVSYGVHPHTHRIDFDEVRKIAKKENPKVIIAGASAYPRIIDFEQFGKIAQEVGAELIADIAHIAGFVATGLHPSSIPHAAYTTTTTHKTLRGPRGGLILCSESRLKAVNSQIFPGIQGGPLMHVIAAKAVAFKEALEPSFKTYQMQILANAQALADELLALGYALISQGTDNHLLLIDLTLSGDRSVTGKEAENWLDQAGITVNKNTIPFEKRSPFVTSGIRIGVPAITTRGMGRGEMKQIAQWIHQVLSTKGAEEQVKSIRNQVRELCLKHPVYRPL